MTTLTRDLLEAITRNGPGLHIVGEEPVLLFPTKGMFRLPPVTFPWSKAESGSATFVTGSGNVIHRLTREGFPLDGLARLLAQKFFENPAERYVMPCYTEPESGALIAVVVPSLQFTLEEKTGFCTFRWLVEELHPL